MAAGYNYQTHLDGPSCCFCNSSTLLLWCLPCRYETSNHLWLILEYCVGGDLMSLLRQDMRLPESSIHDFGRDLVISIQYLHSNAIIYCDLKPSNILLDENGRIKLGGFGLSRRLTDINKTSLQQLPPVRLYMHSGAAWHATLPPFSSMPDCSTHHTSGSCWQQQPPSHEHRGPSVAACNVTLSHCGMNRCSAADSQDWQAVHMPAHRHRTGQCDLAGKAVCAQCLQAILRQLWRPVGTGM